MPSERSGIIAQFRANKISPAAALEQLKAIYDERLHIVKLQVEAARVREAEATETAFRFMAELDARRTARKAAVDNLKAIYHEQLEVLGCQMKEAVRAGQPEAMEAALKSLADLNARHLAALADLIGGCCGNLESVETLRKKAQDETDRQLRCVMSKDWGLALKESAIDRILVMSAGFFAKLLVEIG